MLLPCLFIYLSICLFVFCLFICLFISGLWKGYFVDNRALRGKSAGSKWLIDVNMTFQSRDQFTARGSDEIGSFTFKNGKITGACNTQYIKAQQKWCFSATTWMFTFNFDLYDFIGVWFSFEWRQVIGFALTALRDWLKNSRQYFLSNNNRFIRTVKLP